MLVIDPVCHQHVEAEHAATAGLFIEFETTPIPLSALRRSFGRRRFYFCSPACKEQFELAPSRYNGRGNEAIPPPPPTPPPAEDV